MGNGPIMKHEQVNGKIVLRVTNMGEGRTALAWMFGSNALIIFVLACDANNILVQLSDVMRNDFGKLEQYWYAGSMCTKSDNS